MNMEHGWNDTHTKKVINLKENLSQCHLPTTNHKWTGQALNLALWMRGWKLTTSAIACPQFNVGVTCLVW
jgi:hypothetical protein